MPIYVYWGEDEFAIALAVRELRDRSLDPSWSSFNYTDILADSPDAVIDALNQAMTPPFGAGKRLVWLINSSLLQQASVELVEQLERTLPVLLDSSILLLTLRGKPDKRLKSTKLFQKYGELQEFSPIPPWDSARLLQQAKQMAQSKGVKLTHRATEVLSESVGNDTRRLVQELEKLSLYYPDEEVLNDEVVERLVVSNTQTSFKLAEAIARGDIDQSLSLVEGLLLGNEPALKISATLVSQFRTWLWVKLMVGSGESDNRTIAKAAGVSNPKRVYILQKQVRSLRASALQQTLSHLLELEWSLKQGHNERETLQMHAIAMCQLYQRS